MYFLCCVCFFFFKQKTAYEMRISDWSSDVCSSDLRGRDPAGRVRGMGRVRSVPGTHGLMRMQLGKLRANAAQFFADFFRSEAASGILLIAAALIALVCANTPLNDLYEAFREVPVEVGIGELRIEKPLLLWINAGDRKRTRL